MKAQNTVSGFYFLRTNYYLKYLYKYMKLIDLSISVLMAVT